MRHDLPKPSACYPDVDDLDALLLDNYIVRWSSTDRQRTKMNPVRTRFGTWPSGSRADGEFGLELECLLCPSPNRLPHHPPRSISPGCARSSRRSRNLSMDIPWFSWMGRVAR